LNTDNKIFALPVWRYIVQSLGRNSEVTFVDAINVKNNVKNNKSYFYRRSCSVF